MARWRTIQPAHESDKITVEEAMEAWRKVEERARQRGRSKSVRATKHTVLANPAGSARAKVAADHDASP